MSELSTYIPRVKAELDHLFADSSITPRDYQIEAIAALDLYWDEHKDEVVNPLFWLATGLGKTVIFSMLIRLYFARYMKTGFNIVVVAGNKELVEQAEEKVYSLFPTAQVGVFCASLNRKEIAPITIATRGSIANNVEAFGHQSLILVDECDEIPESETSQYQKIINELRRFNPRIRVIGFTATPFWAKDVIYKNGSKKDDKKIFDHVVYKRDLRWGIENNFLVAPTTKAVSQGEIDTSKIKVSNGDFNIKELEEATARHELVDAAVAEWYKEAFLKNRKCSVFFCTSIKHAEMVSQALNREFNICAPVVHGKTPKKERGIILEQMRKGLLTAVCNVNVLTRGTDIPCVDCLVIVRATQSLRLIIQMVGRGLRLNPDSGKNDCLILDFGENCKRFGSLDKAMPPKSKNEEARVRPCKECNELVSVFAQKCPKCNAQLKPKPSKVCADCNEPNSIGAKSCCNCGQVFVTHKTHAAQGALISSDQMIKTFPVQKVELTIATSRASNQQYIKVSYFSEIFNVYFKSLHLGWFKFHSKAAHDWLSLTNCALPVPSSAVEAMARVKSGEVTLRTVNAIKVDMASKYRDVIDVIYEE